MKRRFCMGEETMKTFLLFLLASILPFEANGGHAMRKEDINDIMTSAARTFDCADRLAAEKMDGLLIPDFRKVESPPFVAKSYGWNFHQSQGDRHADNYYAFAWKLDSMNSNGLGAHIEAMIFSTYEGAREAFIMTRLGASNPNVPWVPCKNKVGTVCAEYRSLLFVYKNVFVEIFAGSLLPDGKPLRDELATWLFDVLEHHPRTLVFPETLDETSAANPETNEP